MVRLVDDHDLEPLFCGQIDLLRLGNFFEQFLDNNAIIGADIGGCYFKVVDRRDDIKFELAVACCLEYSVVDLDLLDARAVEFFKGSNRAGFLASAGWAVHKKVREVATLGLKRDIRA